MKVTSWSRKILPLFLVLSIWSCDDDFSRVGSNIVGDENTNLNSYTSQNLIAYSKATGPVQANGFLVNSFGVIDNPIFGKSEVSFVTQLQFVAGTNPTADIISPTVRSEERRVGKECRCRRWRYT